MWYSNVKKRRIFMKKKFSSIITVFLVIIILAACGNVSSHPQESDLEACIQEISLVAIEDNIAYYDVYIKKDTDWNDNDSFKKELALFSIKQCLEKEESKSATSFSIIGFESDGNTAFSWGGIDGTSEIRYYKSGKHTHNSTITTSEYEYIGFTQETNSDTSQSPSADHSKLAETLFSEINNSNITDLKIEDYNAKQYMICITLDLKYFNNDFSPEKVRDFINITKQIAEKHSDKIFQYYITVINNDIETNFCSWPTGDGNQERFFIKYYQNGEEIDTIVYYFDTAQKVHDN